ncbi:uncharacterized protein EURHEDRAFT_43252 [Aspergillus ruber CBS 135680]|uniref:Uncharacterized protein n=1 Tax=Aspergillus ruber (strain CBS 135680) TaxID=1388766 RepID=A0A017SGV7_ASPRC|nr:uncharacterized protein EURHEDRAFT_43252 [Aspergillus ruber CBS 135680]EYE95981.1 hypothetical protein EURHEDRAFT_43252 [Aspergillus ruber CBS 135680]
MRAHLFNAITNSLIVLILRSESVRTYSSFESLNSFNEITFKIISNNLKPGSGDSSMTLPQLNHDAYTVRWACALRCEVNASRAMLDEEHERLPRAPNDDNSYILGQAGNHNVVIAFPGAGVHGTEAAARTTAHMIRTFRSIRFGLMVGIGREVRLKGHNEVL